MLREYPTATVFGGTGFVGRQVVRELAAKGYRIKVATRVPERAYFLRPCGSVGQVVPFACDYSQGSIEAVIKGSDVVVNCIGILYERGKRSTFQKAHVEIPRRIAEVCRSEKVVRFVHVSSLSSELGVSVQGSKYARSKVAGEVAIFKVFPDAVILRPSVIFGEDDQFFNMFARMVQLLPDFIPLPLIGGGKTKFQPVFVGDVADAVMVGIDNESVSGKIYELGGPQVVSFKEIYDILFSHIGRRQNLIKIPFWVAKIQAFFFSMLPTPLLTMDQVESLKSNSIVDKDSLGFEDLGLQPRSMESVLPSYLSYYRPGGRFSDVTPEV